MRKLAIDFAPATPGRALRTTHAATWCLAIIGLLACSTVAFQVFALARQLDHARIDANKALAERAARYTPKPASARQIIPEAQGNAVNGAIAALNLPWSALFDAIEAASPPTIALLSLDPDGRKHAMRAWAEAKSADEMIAYIERLEAQPFFTGVALTKHEINEQDPNKPIRFQFEARWMDTP